MSVENTEAVNTHPTTGPDPVATEPEGQHRAPIAGVATHNDSGSAHSHSGNELIHHGEKSEVVSQELNDHASSIYPFVIVFLAALTILWGELDFILWISFVGDAILLAAIIGCVYMMSKTVGWTKNKAKAGKATTK